MVQCCSTATKIVRLIRDGKPRMATSTFTQLLNPRSTHSSFCSLMRTLRHRCRLRQELRYLGRMPLYAAGSPQELRYLGRMSLYAAGSPQELRYLGRMSLYAAGSPQGRTAPPSPLCQQARFLLTQSAGSDNPAGSVPPP